MNLNLTGKTALVTGSTQGIGKAISIELAREGVNVLINGRNIQETARVTEEIRSMFPATSPQSAAADLTDPQQRESLFERFPSIDMLINNMGIYEILNYEEASDEVWERYFRTNVLAANALCRFYLPDLLKNHGRILFIASEEAVMPSGQMPHYAVTKSSLLSLSRSLSKLTAGTGATVNTILPGPTLSENVRQIINGLPTQEEGSDFAAKQKSFMANRLPQSELGRFIRPEEIGRLAAFICSPLSGAFRGSPIRMDGGMVPTIY